MNNNDTYEFTYSNSYSKYNRFFIHSFSDLKIFSNNQLSIQDKIMRFETVKILIYAVEYILMVLHYPKGCGPHVTIMIVAFLSRETAKSRKVVVCMRTVENG